MCSWGTNLWRACDRLIVPLPCLVAGVEGSLVCVSTGMLCRDKDAAANFELAFLSVTVNSQGCGAFPPLDHFQ